MKKHPFFSYAILFLLFICIPQTSLMAKHCHKSKKHKSSSSWFSFNLNLNPLPIIAQDYTYVTQSVYQPPVIIERPYVITTHSYPTQVVQQQVYYPSYTNQVIVTQPVYTQRVYNYQRY